MRVIFKVSLCIFVGAAEWLCVLYIIGSVICLLAYWVCNGSFD